MIKVHKMLPLLKFSTRDLNNDLLNNNKWDFDNNIS